MNTTLHDLAPATETTFNIVLTGGPFAGKTTLLQELKKAGYPVVQEQAIRVINELRNKMGQDNYLHWKAEHPFSFQKTILDYQIETEKHITPNGITFFDRGRLDCIAYMSHQKLTCPKSLLKKALSGPCHYDLVINCETLSEYQTRSETGRTEDKHGSTALSKALLNTYIRYGFPVISLKEQPLKTRLSTLLYKVKEFIKYPVPSLYVV